MAEPTFIGLVTVHGLDGAIAYTGLVAADQAIRRLNYTDAIETKRTKDGKGTTKGVKGWDAAPEIEITFAPAKPAGSGSITGAKANVVLPAFGAKVALTGFPPVVGTAGAINSPDWIYFGGGRIEGTNEDDMTITLPLKRYSTDLAATANS